VTLYDLASSYVRRKRFEARLLTVEISQLFRGGKGSETATPPTKTLPADDFFVAMGAKVTQVPR
jgi:hypothetical protein